MGRKVDHKFCSKEIDWGFSAYMNWEEIINPEKGYIKDDTITVEVHLEAEPSQGVSYEFKKPSTFKGVPKSILEEVHLEAEPSQGVSYEFKKPSPFKGVPKSILE